MKLSMFIQPPTHVPRNRTGRCALSTIWSCRTWSRSIERLEAEGKLRQYDNFLAIRSKMLALPIKYQDVIMLRYFERKSVKEIAEILNKKEGTVKSLLSRGIRKLKDLL